MLNLPTFNGCTTERVVHQSGEDATQTLDCLNPTTFTFKGDESGQRHLGFIAEEVPASIATSDRQGFSPMAIIAVLTKVVKEQQEQISALQQAMALLQDKVK